MDRCFLSSLTDDMYGFGIVTRDDLLRQLKINLLLYESVAQGAATFISHRVLHELMQEDGEGEAVRHLVKTEALKPIFMEAGANFSTVARRMVDDRTLAWVSSEDLLGHAESLDAVCPVFELDPMGIQGIRRLQFAEMLRAVRRIESGDAAAAPLSASLPVPGSLTWFLQWLEAQPEPELGVGAVHAFLDGSLSVGRAAREPARIIALAAHCRAMGNSAAVASRGRLNPYTALLGLPEDPHEKSDGRIEVSELSVTAYWPLDAMAVLPLWDISQLRERKPFQAARRLLAVARSGELIDRQHLILGLEEAGADFDRYVQIRPEIRRLLPEKREELKRQFLFETVWKVSAEAVAAGAAVTLFALSSPGGSILLTIVGGAAAAAMLTRAKASIDRAIGDYRRKMVDFGEEYRRPPR